MTREEKKKELTKLFLTAGVSFNDILDEAMNFQIDKACEWLHTALYLDHEHSIEHRYATLEELLNDFRKAMKGGEL